MWEFAFQVLFDKHPGRKWLLAIVLVAFLLGASYNHLSDSIGAVDLKATAAQTATLDAKKELQLQQDKDRVDILYRLEHIDKKVDEINTYLRKIR